MRMAEFNKSNLITSEPFTVNKNVTLYDVNYIWEGEKKSWRNTKTNGYSTLYSLNFKDKIIK